MQTLRSCFDSDSRINLFLVKPVSYEHRLQIGFVHCTAPRLSTAFGHETDVGLIIWQSKYVSFIVRFSMAGHLRSTSTEETKRKGGRFVAALVLDETGVWLKIKIDH